MLVKKIGQTEDQPSCYSNDIKFKSRQNESMKLEVKISLPLGWAGCVTT